MVHAGSAAPFTGGVTTTSQVRVHNERTVFEALFDRRRASASDVIGTTGLSKPTVTAALAALEQVGLVEQAGHRTGGTGRAPRTYHLRADGAATVVVDIGSAWLRAAAVDLTGTVRERVDVAARSSSARALIRQITKVGADLVAAVGPAPVTHCILGSPGVHDPDADAIQLAPNLPGWDAPDVLARLRASLPGELTVENDVNLAALAEHAAFRAAGRPEEDFVFISVGSGLGMGVVADGRLRRGWQGGAGELSYLPRRRTTRDAGSLEAEVGPTAILAAAQRAGLDVTEPSAVFDAARAGNAAGTRVVQAEARRLAEVVAAVVAILDPPLVVLGGAVGRNGDLLLDPMRRALAGLVPLRSPELRMSTLGVDATLRGAVAQGISQMRSHIFDVSTRVRVTHG